MMPLVVLLGKLKLYIVLSVFIIFFVQAKGQRVTFYNDVAPIIEKNCLTCHYKGGPTPFALDNYESVASRAKFITFLTEKRIMPPWKANPEYVHFANERYMSNEEIKLIKAWFDQGLKMGRLFPKKLENPIRQSMGEPNLILSMPDSVEIKGDNTNRYLTYKVPFEIDQDTFGLAFEFIPGNTNVLHHASFQILEVDSSADIFQGPFYGETKADRIMDDGWFYKHLHLIGENGIFPKIVYANSWLPGSSMQLYDEDIAFEIPKRGVILYNYIHYSPSPINQKDNSSIRFYFSEERPKKLLKEFLLKPNFKGMEGLIAKNTVKEVSLKKYLSSSIEVYTVIPHMHKLGKYFKAYAIVPNGDTIPLVEVKDWDFNWQEYYVFKEPIVLPKRTVIIGEAVFDNTENNLANPSKPPSDVYFEGSMNETSEMMHLILLISESKKTD